MSRSSSPDIPADLLAAFEAYERAILSNDLEVLDASFALGPETLRGDSGGLLVGHDAISAFRGIRGGVPARTIDRLEYRPLGGGSGGSEGGSDVDAALLVSVSRYAAGGAGLQTQLWQQIDGRWLITAAHVTPRAPAFDRSMWRIVGDPLRHGAAEGPLTGLTVAVKDLFAVEGHRIGAGNPAFLEGAEVEHASAAAVTDLLRGGASLRGIARTDEFAFSIAGDNAHYGTPPNSALPGALPGGSSSGPASAVASGQADVALATDTAGSIRVPASYQGLWGLRTTHARVSREGMLPLAPSFDTVGWLTRDGETLQRVADWCLGDDPSGSHAGGDLPWRFLVLEEALVEAEEPTRQAFEMLIERLVAGGDPPRVRRVSIGSLADFLEPFRIVQAAEAWRGHGQWVRANAGSLGSAVAERFRFAASVTPDEEDAARSALGALGERVARLVRDDVLILPTAPGHAPPRTAQGTRIDAIRQATLRMTTPAAIAGLPAVSVPLLTTSSALGRAPVGVSLISRAGSDPALVRLARRLATHHEARTEQRTELP